MVQPPSNSCARFALFRLFGTDRTNALPPSFPQDANLDTIVLNGVGSAGQQDGVVVDEDGEVVAYWGSFSVQISQGGRLNNIQIFQGIPSDIIAEAVEPLKRGEANPAIRSLGVEFE